jgi:hypothetical protein
MRPCVETHELAPFNSSNAEPLSPPTNIPSRATAKQPRTTKYEKQIPPKRLSHKRISVKLVKYVKKEIAVKSKKVFCLWRN